MSDQMRDSDGYVYEKNWAGQWVEKPELFTGQARDTSGLKESEPARDWLGRQETTWDGKPLYRSREESISSSGSGSASSLEALGTLLLALVFIAVLLSGVVIIATPILAPILLSSAARAERSGNIAEAQKRRRQGEAASVVAVLVVFGIAGIIGLLIFLVIASFAQNTTNQIVAELIYILAAGVALLATVLSAITGIAPTAVVCLRHKETQLRALGKSKVATRVRKLAWAFAITASGTVGLTALGFGALIVFAVIASMLNRAP
jgi:hypothetical protein